MKYMTTMALAIALAMPMAAPANAWKDFANWFKHPKVKSAFEGMKKENCWKTGTTFGAIKTDCDLF